MPMCRLYAWGANSHGQLGLGFESEQSTLPQEVDLSSIEVDPSEIVKIVGGAGHTLMLDKNGRVYSCGWNAKGQTGVDGAGVGGVVLRLRSVDGLDGERIRDVACGWDCSMALTENGRVFVWGSNCYGQLGWNKERRENFGNLVSEPDIINGPCGQRIKAIAMGLRHSALLTEGGTVLVAGSGSKCQLGIFDHDGQPVKRLSAFTLIPGLADVVAVACGENHTVAVRKTGEIYSWGDNKHGQLGFDNTRLKTIDHPTELKIPGVEKIRELRAGWSHTSILNEDDGRIFAWGRNTYGQLGYREDKANATWIPKCVPIAPKILQLSVGSEHNVALTEDGTVLSWGWNEHGNCGNGSTRDVLAPVRVEVLSRDARGILVGGGAGHSFAIFADDV